MSNQRENPLRNGAGMEPPFSLYLSSPLRGASRLN